MRLLVAVLIVTLAALASPASAQEAKPGPVAELWKRVGPWAIWSRRDNNTCFLDSQARGPTIFVGYEKSRKLMMGLTHQAWRSLEVGKDYPMIVQIDDQQHAGLMNAWMRPDGSSVVIGRTFDDADQGRRFLQDFQRGSQLSVIYQGQRLASYVLQASQAAGDELDRCQAAQNKDNDPFKPKGTAGGATPDKSGPPAAAGATMPKLTADQRVEALRLAANLLTRLPGFRILSEEEQKAIDPKVAALEAAVVWRNEGAMGLLHLFPNVSEAQIPKIAAGLIGGMAEDCNAEFNGTMTPDVRSPSVRRIHTSCAQGSGGQVMRMILMPVKGGVYYFSTSGELKNNAAVVRTEELLRNALFEVVQK